MSERDDRDCDEGGQRHPVRLRTGRTLAVLRACEATLVTSRRTVARQLDRVQVRLRIWQHRVDPGAQLLDERAREDIADGSYWEQSTSLREALGHAPEPIDPTTTSAEPPKPKAEDPR